MKIIREHIYEKFSEDSDPIDDIGIGMNKLLIRFMKKFKIIDYSVALAYAAEYGQLELVKYLIDSKDADIHICFDYPLRYAAGNGHIEIVKYLLSTNKINTQTSFYNQAIDWAKHDKHTKIIKILKDHIAKEKKNKVVRENLNEKFTEDSDPISDLEIGLSSQYKKWCEETNVIPYSLESLIRAIYKLEYDFVHYLLFIKKLDVHGQRELNNTRIELWEIGTPLRVAISTNNIKMIDILLKAGANPNHAFIGNWVTSSACNQKKTIKYIEEKREEWNKIHKKL